MLGHPRCKATIRDLIARPDTDAFVSASTAWELATKVRIGKWPEGEAIVSDLPAIIAENDFAVLPVSLDHGRMAGLFETPHNDRFDRMLAAQAKAEAMPLVTADRALRAFGIETIW